MLTRTTIAAIRLLIHLGAQSTGRPASMRPAAAQLGESPTYLAKIARELVKAGILRAHRGVSGGVLLENDPKQVSMLEIVEACQGHIYGDFCEPQDDLELACAFHQANAQLHEATIRILSKWTLADLIRCPAPAGSRVGKASCWLQSPQRPHATSAKG